MPRKAAAPAAATVTKRKSKTMTAAHKEALATGRTEGRAIRDYLEALEAHKPRRGRKRTAATISTRIDTIEAAIDDASPLDRLHYHQELADLRAELENMTADSNVEELEAGFIAAAAGYSERKGISYDVWRTMGITPAVLRAAGIKR